MTSEPKRRKSNRTPQPRLHKSGQAAVDLNGRTFYLGKFGTPAADKKYDALIAEWLANDRKPIRTKEKVEHRPADGLSVAELALKFRTWAESTYVKNGKQTSEAHSVGLVMRLLGDMHGDLPAEAFTHRHFVEFRDSLTGRYVRSTLSHHMRRVRTMFRWAAEHDYCSFDVPGRIAMVRPLKKGAAGIREAKPTRPANDADVDKVKAVVRPLIRAAIEFQRRTGCRAGEMFALRPRDLDKSGDVWLYKLDSHKTEAYAERVVMIGERAKAAILPLLEDTAPDELVFRHRSGVNRGKPMTTQKFAFAVKRGCLRAKVPRWRPHQLRHSRLTELRNAGMLEGAQAVAGHQTLQMTQHYAKLHMDKGVEAAKASG